jgi:hypothetical protein
VAVKGAQGSVPSQRILQSIATASQRTGVSFGYLLNQARTESSFNPAAKAPTSSASGLFQFTNQTWLSTVRSHGAEHGLGWAADAIQRGQGGTLNVPDPGLRQQILDLRYDPEASSAMAGEFASDNSDFLSQHLSRQVDEADLSIAHFLGAPGALKFLTALAQSPEASAAPYFPEAAGANASVFFGPGGAPRSFAEIHARFAAKANAPAPAGTALIPSATQEQAVVRQEVSNNISGGTQGWTGRMAQIEPMPDRLSLSFAQEAYRKLASMGGTQ